MGFPLLFCLVASAVSAAPDFWDEIPLSPSTTMPLQIQDDYWNGEFQRVNREVSSAAVTIGASTKRPSPSVLWPTVSR